jgi:GT2 family glycosyltransferase
MSGVRVAVTIPYYREHDKLERCLAHLHAQTHPGVEVFVRDNSIDNVYFTAAVNEGLRRFIVDPTIDYLMILNQDAYLEQNAIQLLAEFLERHPEAGVACPLQLDEHGAVSWGGSLQSFPLGVHRGGPIESFQSPCETPWGNGAALMIRAEVVREVGLLDRNMRFICSDVDYTLSVRARGWKVYLVPEARCQHTLSGSVGGNLELETIKLQDALYFARKWVSGDLYRSLAYEGPQLLRTQVRIEIRRFEQALEGLQRLRARAQ